MKKGIIISIIATLILAVLILSILLFSFTGADVDPPTINAKTIEMNTEQNKNDLENAIMDNIDDNSDSDDELTIVIIDNTCDSNKDNTLIEGNCEIEVSVEDQSGNKAEGIISVSIATLEKNEEPTEQEPQTSNDTNTENQYANNELVIAKPCDTSGYRAPNAKVDIGYDSDYATRDYYAYTNEYSQLVYVEADEIVLQNDDVEDVNSDNRYCNDEAKVTGTESSTLDEGHAIADSLGGVSNAYNITPQNSDLNRSGEQANMEETIRSYEESGNDVTNFIYTIEYPNTSTQTPSYYTVSFDVNGTTMTYEFANEVVKDENEEPPISNGEDEPQFSSCSEREENGYNDPLYENSDPEYEWYNDGDSDGIVCE